MHPVGWIDGRIETDVGERERKEKEKSGRNGKMVKVKKVHAHTDKKYVHHARTL